MGSGAFLVEACRQLGDELMKAWHAHDEVPSIPPDEDEALYAQRIVAQRCLYGVDKNPMAVDLAKLSLWLATLAKDHPFTFLDHSLRHGDSLVGLTRQQIAAFHWRTSKAAELTWKRRFASGLSESASTGSGFSQLGRYALCAAQTGAGWGRGIAAAAEGGRRYRHCGILFSRQAERSREEANGTARTDRDCAEGPDRNACDGR